MELIDHKVKLDAQMKWNPTDGVPVISPQMARNCKIKGKSLLIHDFSSIIKRRSLRHEKKIYAFVERTTSWRQEALINKVSFISFINNIA